MHLQIHFKATFCITSQDMLQGKYCQGLSVANVLNNCFLIQMIPKAASVCYTHNMQNLHVIDRKVDCSMLQKQY